MTFKTHYLRNTLHKPLSARNSDSSNGSGQSQLKTFLKEFTIRDAIKNILDSWKEAKIATLSGLQKLIPTLMDLRLQWRSYADVMEIARELELEVVPEDVTELLSFHDQTSDR